MVDIHNFIASLKCIWIKKLTQCHRPFVNISKEISCNDFQKRLIDFVDVYLLDKVQRNNIFCQDVLFLLCDL